MAKFIHLVPLEGMRDLACEEFVAALVKAGHAVRSLPLRAAPKPGCESGAMPVEEVLDFAPDAMVTRGGMGLNRPAFFLSPGIDEIPVAALWFDDPLRPLALFKKTEGYAETLRRRGMFHFVWDGYWREWFAAKHGVESHPIHLAADPEAYHPEPGGADDGAVYFVGTLASPRVLEAKIAGLPPVLRKVGAALMRALPTKPYGANPYDVLEEVMEGLPATLKAAAVDARAAVPEHDTDLLAVAWMAGKNETRARALRAVLGVAPVRVLSANIEGTQASRSELLGLLGSTRFPVHFQDTGHLGAGQLRELYRDGLVHFQATDPQSVWGGVPFRVFQTAACGKALVSDWKRELGECFQEGEEMAYYRDESGIADAVAARLADPEGTRAMGEAALARFTAEHTWAHRVQQVISTVLVRTG